MNVDKLAIKAKFRSSSISAQVCFYITTLSLNVPKMVLEAVHNRHPQSGERGLVLQMRTSALFGVKNFGFFEIYGESARTSVESGRSIFRNYGRHRLWTVLCF